MLLLALTALARSETPAPAAMWAHDPDGFGLGLVLGLPTGLSAAWRPGGPVWGEAAVAWSFETNGLALDVHGLYTVATPAAEHNQDFLFPIYVGAGARVRIGGDAGQANFNQPGFGVTVPFGMALQHTQFPLEAFVELAPGIGFSSRQVVPLFDAVVGARFYFGSTDTGELARASAPAR